MPQQTSTFEACSWVPILQVGGLGKVRVNCFPQAIATWHGRESNPRPPDLESDALTTPPRCPSAGKDLEESYLSIGVLNSWDVVLSKRALDEAKHQGALAHPTRAKHHHSVVIGLLWHGAYPD
ncbi:hypothetical protein ElyMa_000573700 [Elysia marginata]|uniref:Uncharacterized protein n=1 Tax=Elysia marginata TaxID=1093978 RepID=A0AAV4G4H8_9GAST|nr:hypothetical protein ElyMa_000573700 [Elysia marginata]